MATTEQKIADILWDQLTLEKEDQNTTPSSTTNTPSKKKKSLASSRLCRDSQASRESPGKPGSKRYNRFLNQQYLKEGGILKDKFEVEYEYSLVDTNDSLLYQDNYTVWEPYVNIAYDRQQEKVSSFVQQEQERRKIMRKTSRINESFSLLRRDLRESFKKPFVQNSYFITTAEQKMLEFILDDSITSTEVVLESSFQRLLLHGLGSYYSLLTGSQYNKEGQRIVTITKPKVMPPLPELSITDYITKEQKKNKQPFKKYTSSSRSRSNSFQTFKVRA